MKHRILKCFFVVVVILPFSLFFARISILIYGIMNTEVKKKEKKK
jgi:hypothetical protein